MLSFWAQRGALSSAEAQRRLPEVVCVLRSDDRVRGVSSVYSAPVPLVGGRCFWIYRSLLDGSVAEELPDLIRATFDALHADFDPSGDGPIGLCVLIADPRERRRRPEAEWSDPRMIYAGYLADDRQVRIAYFEGARVHS